LVVASYLTSAPATGVEEAAPMAVFAVFAAVCAAVISVFAAEKALLK
jgi:hypothetical protein